MVITKISGGLPLNEQIRQLNNQTFALAGMIDDNNFMQSQIDNIHTKTGIEQKYTLDQYFFTDVDVFATLTPVITQSGYSVWRVEPDNYAYAIENQLFMDDKLLVNKGAALSESSTAFDYVYLHDAIDDVYTDITAETIDDGDNNTYPLMNDTTTWLYMGLDAKFNGATFKFKNKASGFAIQTQYWNGTAWIDLDSVLNDYTDNTNNMSVDGNFMWTAPGDWAANAVNAQTKYWIRMRTAMLESTYVFPEVYYIIPANSVKSILTLTNQDVLNERWAWCSYNGSIYLTVRNSGNTNYEGNYYISSSASYTSLINFFVYNHTFKLNHLKADYNNGGINAALIPFNYSGMTATNVADAIKELFDLIG